MRAQFSRMGSHGSFRGRRAPPSLPQVDRDAGRSGQVFFFVPDEDVVAFADASEKVLGHFGGFLLGGGQGVKSLPFSVLPLRPAGAAAGGLPLPASGAWPRLQSGCAGWARDRDLAEARFEIEREPRGPLQCAVRPCRLTLLPHSS